MQAVRLLVEPQVYEEAEEVPALRQPVLGHGAQPMNTGPLIRHPCVKCGAAKMQQCRTRAGNPCAAHFARRMRAEYLAGVVAARAARAYAYLVRAERDYDNQEGDACL